MPPLAPVITVTVADDFYPCPAGTQVAVLAQPPEETDPGPFTYDAGPVPPSVFEVAGTSLTAAVDLTGSNLASVTVTTPLGTSPATDQDILVGDAPAGGSFPTDDPYLDNPQLPPPTPDTERWRFFLRTAVHDIMPRARFGIDFMVSRTAGKNSGQDVHGWDDVLLGAYPQAEVEARAQALADAWPWSEPLPTG